jgi:asparagine synthase (glutamine-hydrolysing)
MCGIAGFIERNGRAPEMERLRRMTDCIAHRGPDDEGQAIYGSVALGQRRLSIVDLSPQGHQPMAGADDSVAIIYNGEVYNHAKIRDALPPGVPYRGHSDTEVVARALQTSGTRSLAGLNGIFSLAFLDHRSGELILARDHFGIKPMYFAQDADRFYFGSEVKSILAAGYRAEFSPLAPLDFCYTGWTSDERTFLRGVKRLPPGSFLRYNLRTGEWRVEKYYTPGPDAERARAIPATYEAWKGEIASQLERTVDMQLMADVPVGTFCSGGIDSSLITALAAKRHKEILAYNVTCPDAPEVDEGPFAEAVARHVGVKLNSFALTRDEFRKALVHTVWVTEYPLSFVNTVPLYLLSKMARDQGVKVLLSGEGADETFGGYVWQYRSLALAKVAAHYGAPGKLVLDGLNALARKLGGRLGYSAPGDPMNLGMHELLTGGLRSRTLRQRARETYASMPDPIDREIAAELLRQLQSYMLPILHRTDRASMAASVEARVPFLDPDLVSLALAMPPSYKCGVKGLRPVGKAILKDIACQHLPREIVYRPKMGFTVPTKYYTGAWPAAWMESGFVVSEFPIDRQEFASWIAQAGDQTLAWMLTLEIWGQLFIRGRSVADVSQEFLAAR